MFQTIDFEYDIQDLDDNSAELLDSSTDNQKSSRRNVSRRDKERQKKQHSGKIDRYEDKWN